MAEDVWRVIQSLHIVKPVVVGHSMAGSECRDSERLNKIEMEFMRGWESNLRHADPLAQIVELPGAHHDMFQNEEADVLREMKTFLRGLN